MAAYARSAFEDPVFNADQHGLVGHAILGFENLRKIADQAAQLLDVSLDIERAQSLAGYQLDIDVSNVAQNNKAASPGKICIRTLSDGCSLLLLFSQPRNPTAPKLKVLMADGRPIPKWVKHNGPNLYLPSAAHHKSEFALQVILTHPIGSTERYVLNVSPVTATLVAEKVKADEQALSFADQLELAANGQVKALQEIEKQLRHASSQETKVQQHPHPLKSAANH